MIEPYYQDEAVTLYHGDCRDVIASLPSSSVDACVTDPPYELGFMGRKWDASGIAYDKWLWAEAWRVLKPGAHVLAFGGTRTWHRLACAIEDAGFEIRDSIAWLYGSGFPKSLDVSKAIDKAAGAEREVVGVERSPFKVDNARGNATTYMSAVTGDTRPMGEDGYQLKVTTAPATPEAVKWQGWGTALKPAFEPIVVARKPLAGTVAENVLAWGTGALNIDGCRIGTDGGTAGATAGPSDGIYGNGLNGERSHPVPGLGRWPANVILDESQAAELDRQSGMHRDGVAVNRNRTFEIERRGEIGMTPSRVGQPDVGYGGEGGASRFFYTSKASSAERPRVDGIAHPTVKPLDLMQYLVRLVTPPGGTVLDPFAGSGTTIEACIAERFGCIAVELTEEYLPLIMQRISKPIEVTLL